MVKPFFATDTFKVPPAVKPLMGSVYGLLPVSVPLVMPLTPLKVMSAALNPVIGALKDKVSSVLVCEEEPLAVTLEKATAIGGVT
jgi:hypothetical protein